MVTQYTSNKWLKNSAKQITDPFVEATRLAAQTSTQVNAEFCSMEYDACAEMDELNRIHMQEFAIKAEEAMRCSKTYLRPGSRGKTLTT